MEAPFATLQNCLFLRTGVLPLIGLPVLMVFLIPFSGAVPRSCPPQCVCETRPWFTPQSVYHEAKTVDCNDLLLTNVPANLSADTQVLLLQSNKISRVSSELQSLDNLTELDLSQNHFASIEDVGLVNLSQLITLYLEENQVRNLPNYCLKDLSNLEELYINHNQISSIDPEAFSGLTNLLRLHLNANKLQSIDNRWFQALPNLEILMIGENPIVALQSMNFQPLGKLHSLVLAGMELQEIPEDAFMGLDYLESLSFFDNKLSRVPKEGLRKLPLMKFLDLNKNPIEKILAGDFQDMPHLQELSLNNMDDLVSVEHSAFQGLPELAKLEMRNNPRLSFIDRLAFQDTLSLKTLLLSNSDLHLVPREVFRSLPNLKELSLYGNPIRCDCSANWGILSNRSVRLSEPQSTLCASPPQLNGHSFKEILENGLFGDCLPMISIHTFPSYFNKTSSMIISLDCRAMAEPEPEFYWITPLGKKVTRDMESNKHKLLAGGTLMIVEARPEDSGLYTCVAWNSDGSDTKSTTVHINGSTEEKGLALVVLAKKVQSHFVVVEWKVFPGSASPQWSSATMRIHNPHISYTAKVPLDIKEYNLTHLQPATKYEICLTVSSVANVAQRSCLNITTKEASLAVEMVSQVGGMALVAVLGSLFAALSMVLLVLYVGHQLKQKSCHHSLKKYVQHTSSIPLNELYPPLINLWENESEKEKDCALEQPPAPPTFPMPSDLQIDTLQNLHLAALRNLPESELLYPSSPSLLKSTTHSDCGCTWLTIV
ncbi:leucine-rich repeat neuronal protein 1-like [Rhinatrema bivittatum]|uniref:leucine-rich repeat neuronal protein 1-like n=1 Tax=Rhinatrema bivittatum TaxID=194408 RepID=UPI00112E5870|nr:leucine-rich repeat neuronal protein 1-like [Rhinatrema bivittatum]